jgi:formylglycine-generating enzyme required for sulfatase activity
MPDFPGASVLELPAGNQLIKGIHALGAGNAVTAFSGFRKGCQGMNGRRVACFVLAASFFLFFIAGCAGSGMQSSVPGEIIQNASPGELPIDAPGAMISKSGGSAFSLKCGWNTLVYLRPRSKKFTSVTMTCQGKTRLLGESVPAWTQNRIMCLRGRAWQQIPTASMSASFLPNMKYYVWSSRNCIVLDFDKPHVISVSPNGGPVGTQVTIVGRNFGDVQGSAFVTFGDVSSGCIPPENWSDTRITLASPAHGAVVVSVNSLRSNDDRTFEPIEFLSIPAGSFMMGSPDGEGESDEYPRHEVFLDAYEIGKYEVTNAQFASFVAATGFQAQGDWRNAGGYLAGYAAGNPNHPVVNVTWNDAKAFCDHYGYRLPTEAEWEKADRGTDDRNYPWGNTWDANLCCNYSGPATPGMVSFFNQRGTTPVGSFLSGASPYGLMDSAGNVWEWCSDRYAANYYSTLIPPVINPTGPLNGSFRVLRGGGWNGDYPKYFRCAKRHGYPNDGTHSSFGFRAARDVP